MAQWFYKIIYARGINYVLRNINKGLKFLLPNSVKIPPSGKIKVDVQGKTLWMETNQTNYLTHLVFWNGALDFEYTPIFLKLAEKIDCFFDIGANIGYYSLLAALVNSKAKVVSFEPAKGPLHFLRRNIADNNFKNITAESIALSDKDGEINFFEVKNRKYRYLEYNLAGDGNTGSMGSDRSFEVNTVKTTTLDSYVADKGITKIDLIKMDTEGTENLILEHALNVLTEQKPIFICETLFGQIENEMETIFKLHGYEFFNHHEEGLVQVPTIQRTIDNGVRNCFFVHPSKRNLIEEFIVKKV